MRKAVALLCWLSLIVGCSSPPRKGQGSRQAGCSDSEIEDRKVVLAFYEDGLINLRPREAFERYVADSFIEHKPDVPGGTKQSTVAFLEELIKEVPDPKWEVLRTIAEDDLVFVHARFTPAADAPPYAVADVFRLQNCRIVEHWDVVAGPSKESRNPHSRF